MWLELWTDSQLFLAEIIVRVLRKEERRWEGSGRKGLVEVLHDVGEEKN